MREILRTVVHPSSEIDLEAVVAPTFAAVILNVGSGHADIAWLCQNISKPFRRSWWVSVAAT